jgi:hypothetical protein
MPLKIGIVFLAILLLLLAIVYGVINSPKLRAKGSNQVAKKQIVGYLLAEDVYTLKAAFNSQPTDGEWPILVVYSDGTISNRSEKYNNQEVVYLNNSVQGHSGPIQPVAGRSTTMYRYVSANHLVDGYGPAMLIRIGMFSAIDLDQSVIEGDLYQYLGPNDTQRIFLKLGTGYFPLHTTLRTAQPVNTVVQGLSDPSHTGMGSVPQIDGNTYSKLSSRIFLLTYTLIPR